MIITLVGLGDFTVKLVYYTNVQETAIRINAIEGNITISSSNPTRWAEIQSYISDGLQVAPCPYGIVPDALLPYYIYDFDIEEWVLDLEAFTPHLITQLREHRRTSAENAAEVVREHNFGTEEEPEIEELGLKPDDNTISAVLVKTTKSEWNISAETVMFRFSSYTPKDAVDIGNRIVSIGFLQDFYDELDSRNQMFRNYEEATLQQHLTTPFTTVEAAISYYNSLAGE